MINNRTIIKLQGVVSSGENYHAGGKLRKERGYQIVHLVYISRCI